jgi:hypothetical protein
VTAELTTDRASLTTSVERLPQPYAYRAPELVEPDWTRFPGWADVTEAEWESAQWQRSHCVKNLRQLRHVVGPGLDERFLADLERDQAERATMSMLLPPQMLNTMVPTLAPSDPSFTDAFYADPVAATCCRCSPTAAPTGRATPSPPVTPCTSTTCGWRRASRTATRPRCWPSC